MLQFLLDEHVSPRVAEAVQAIRPEIVVMSINAWEDGQYVGQDDSAILIRAYERGFTLVTYDQATIPPLLVSSGERGTSHAGVIFASSRSIPTSDIGSIARALVRMWDQQRELDWTNRIAYIVRS